MKSLTVKNLLALVKVPGAATAGTNRVSSARSGAGFGTELMAQLGKLFPSGKDGVLLRTKNATSSAPPQIVESETDALAGKLNSQRPDISKETGTKSKGEFLSKNSKPSAGKTALGSQIPAGILEQAMQTPVESFASTKIIASESEAVQVSETEEVNSGKILAPSTAVTNRLTALKGNQLGSKLEGVHSQIQLNHRGTRTSPKSTDVAKSSHGVEKVLGRNDTQSEVVTNEKNSFSPVKSQIVFSGKQGKNAQETQAHTQQPTQLPQNKTSGRQSGEPVNRSVELPESRSEQVQRISKPTVSVVNKKRALHLNSGKGSTQDEPLAQPIQREKTTSEVRTQQARALSQPAVRSSRPVLRNQEMHDSKSESRSGKDLVQAHLRTSSHLKAENTNLPESATRNSKMQKTFPDVPSTSTERGISNKLHRYELSKSKIFQKTNNKNVRIEPEVARSGGGLQDKSAKRIDAKQAETSQTGNNATKIRDVHVKSGSDKVPPEAAQKDYRLKPEVSERIVSKRTITVPMDNKTAKIPDTRLEFSPAKGIPKTETKGLRIKSEAIQRDIGLKNGIHEKTVERRIAAAPTEKNTKRMQNAPLRINPAKTMHEAIGKSSNVKSEPERHDFAQKVELSKKVATKSAIGEQIENNSDRSQESSITYRSTKIKQQENYNPNLLRSKTRQENEPVRTFTKREAQFASKAPVAALEAKGKRPVSTEIQRDGKHEVGASEKHQQMKGETKPQNTNRVQTFSQGGKSYRAPSVKSDASLQSHDTPRGQKFRDDVISKVKMRSRSKTFGEPVNLSNSKVNIKEESKAVYRPAELSVDQKSPKSKSVLLADKNFCESIAPKTIPSSNRPEVVEPIQWRELDSQKNLENWLPRTQVSNSKFQLKPQTDLAEVLNVSTRETVPVITGRARVNPLVQTVHQFGEASEFMEPRVISSVTSTISPVGEKTDLRALFAHRFTTWPTDTPFTDSGIASALSSMRRDELVPDSRKRPSLKSKTMIKANNAASAHGKQSSTASIETVTEPSKRSSERESSWAWDKSLMPTEDWHIQSVESNLESLLQPRLSIKVEQLHELRALLERVLKASQPLRLDKGSGLQFSWKSKEWGSIKFVIGQSEQEVVAKVQVATSEVRTLLEKHQDVLRQVFSEQGLRLDRFEVESVTESKTVPVPEVRRDESRRHHERHRESAAEPVIHFDEDIPAKGLPRWERPRAGRVWVA